MNTIDHLLVVISEECTEILSDYFEGKDISFEVIDLYASIDLFRETSGYEYKNGQKITSLDEFLKKLLKIQYFVSKSLRFGLEDNYKGTREFNNIDELMPLFYEITQYIKNANFDSFGDKVILKKERILRFLEYAKEKGIVY